MRLGLGLGLSRGSGSGGFSPVSGFGLNLATSYYYDGQRNYMNLAKYSRWLRSDNAVLYDPDVVDGELITMNGGLGVKKLIGYPRVSSRIRATFTPGATATFSGTGVTNVTNGSGWAEADIAVPADRQGLTYIEFT